jgi:hypothetical protein
MRWARGQQTELDSIALANRSTIVVVVRPCYCLVLDDSTDQIKLSTSGLILVLQPARLDDRLISQPFAPLCIFDAGEQGSVTRAEWRPVQKDVVDLGVRRMR